jgi:hypothetical protein
MDDLAMDAWQKGSIRERAERPSRRYNVRAVTQAITILVRRTGKEEQLGGIHSTFFSILYLRVASSTALVSKDLQWAKLYGLHRRLTQWNSTNLPFGLFSLKPKRIEEACLLASERKALMGSQKRYMMVTSSGSTIEKGSQCEWLRVHSSYSAREGECTSCLWASSHLTLYGLWGPHRLLFGFDVEADAC